MCGLHVYVISFDFHMHALFYSTTQKRLHVKNPTCSTLDFYMVCLL